MNNTGALIKQLRKEKHISAETIAERLECTHEKKEVDLSTSFFSHSHIRRIENAFHRVTGER